MTDAAPVGYVEITYLPVVRAVRDGEGFLSFRCRWCGAVHHHGRSDGPRLSHCRAPGAPKYYTLRGESPWGWDP